MAGGLDLTKYIVIEYRTSIVLDCYKEIEIMYLII